MGLGNIFGSGDIYGRVSEAATKRQMEVDKMEGEILGYPELEKLPPNATKLEVCKRLKYQVDGLIFHYNKVLELLPPKEA